MTVTYLPEPIRLRAGMQVVRERAHALRASPDALRRALHVLLREMQAGRSTAAAVALAHTSMAGRQPAPGGTAA